MTDRKDSGKDALSRALGAAFLSHRVEELEKTVSAGHKHPEAYANDRRDRRLSPTFDNNTRGRGSARGRGNSTRPQRGGRTRGADDTRDERTSDPEYDGPVKKDADVIVVDASVLIHAIGQLKSWCRPNRDEIVIVPLEALNTLDLLKKGTMSLAQRARAASRILEQQVGTNPRIKVQSDDAFVLWDTIPFERKETNEEADSNEAVDSHPTPEWLRRTICCARWEMERFSKELDTEQQGENESRSKTPSPAVVLAVCTSPLESSGAVDEPLVPSPIPLPAPQPPSKFEQRCLGTLVAHWGKTSGIHVLDVKPTPLPSSGPPGNGRRTHVRSSSDEEWRSPISSKKSHHHQSGRGRGSASRGSNNPGVYGPGRSGGALVERPAATVAMNASLMQPAKVIRVLARGEKLDP